MLETLDLLSGQPLVPWARPTIVFRPLDFSNMTLTNVKTKIEISQEKGLQQVKELATTACFQSNEFDQF